MCVCKDTYYLIPVKAVGLLVLKLFLFLRTLTYMQTRFRLQNKSFCIDIGMI